VGGQEQKKGEQGDRTTGYLADDKAVRRGGDVAGGGKIQTQGGRMTREKGGRLGGFVCPARERK